ncbi:MAG TPA: hypothetical protein VFZ38_19375, partial [Vicinamibacterales bacterium]
LFPMAAAAPGASAPNQWATLFGGIATGTLDLLRQREQRKLEQTYVRAGETAPASLLAPAAGAAAPSNPWPLLALAAGAFVLMSRK